MPPARRKRRHGILRSYLGSSEDRKTFSISHFSFLIFHCAQRIQIVDSTWKRNRSTKSTERSGAPLEQVWSASTFRHYKHSNTVPGALATTFN